MRVIAGSAKRLLLKTTSGMDTRPTADRIKETLFNMIQNEIPGCLFLDLFAGSGAIGIEALSRGAKQAVFIENDSRALSCIRENLAATHLEERAAVIAADVLSGLRRVEKSRGPFDIVFMDPPYNHAHEKGVLSYLKDSELIDIGTALIVEASLDTDFGYLDEMGYEVLREKKYKTNQHLFLRKR